MTDALVPALAALAEPMGIDALHGPDLLPWLAGAIALGLLLALRRRPTAVAWPGLFEVSSASAWRREPVRWLAFALRAGALAALALVLLGPVALRERPPEPGLGLDIVLVLDTSASMRALDTRFGGETRTRLALAREVVARFAGERVAAGDRVGLVVFGERAFTQCPLTSDGGLLASALARVEVGLAGESTALGDALALGVKRAAAAGDDPAGRVVVLLTDGRSNAGAVPVAIATELARGEDVRVHTVGIGTGGEEVPMAAPGARGLRFERHDPDLATLRVIASESGGRAFEARRAADLAAVYGEIDSLERVARPLPGRVHETPRPEPALAAAGALLLGEILLARLLLRRLP